MALIKICQLNEVDGNADADIKKKTALKPIEKANNSSKTEIEPAVKSVKKEITEPPKEVNSEPETVAPLTPTPKLSKSKISGMGISLTSLAKKDEELVKTPEQEIAANGNNKFTQDDLINAWNEYADNLNIEKLLKNTMSLYKPTLVSEVLFEVKVNSELNKEYLTSNGESLLTFLREKVKNDNLTMTIKIAKGNVIKKALTSREIFDEMVEKNSNLQNLSDEFGLELS